MLPGSDHDQTGSSLNSCTGTLRRSKQNRRSLIPQARCAASDSALCPRGLPLVCVRFSTLKLPLLGKLANAEGNRQPDKKHVHKEPLNESRELERASPVQR